MAIKSVVDIEVNDEAFKKFAELFTAYQEELHKSSEDWTRTDEGTKRIRKNFAQMVKDLTEAKKQSKETRTLAKDAAAYWEKLSENSRKFAGWVRDAGSSLLRVSSLTTAVTGLLGVGGLFGLDRLADAVSAGRRSSLGLGTSYGEQKAFGVNFGRVVDAGGVLGGVNEALRDATKRYTLYGAGLTEGDLRGKNTAEVAAALIPKLKTLADQTPDALLGQVIAARGLGQFVSTEDMLRLKSTPRGELNEYSLNYQRDRRSLGLDQRGQKTWQDFSVQMSRAGQKIENVFVRGLEPLIPGLNKLSESFTKAIDTLLTAAQKKHWLEEFGAAIENVAKYIASEKFQQDIKDFVEDISALAKAVRNGLEALGVVPQHQGGTPGLVWSQGVGGFFDSARARLKANGFASNDPSFWSHGRGNNVANLRPVGANTGFRSFSDIDQGVIALAKDLQYKERVHHLTTIRGLVSRFAPPNENDTKAYISDVSGRTKYGADQYLNLNDKTVLARVMAAIIRHESPRAAKRLPEKVIVEILNNTGGNANVTSSQIAK